MLALKAVAPLLPSGRFTEMCLSDSNRDQHAVELARLSASVVDL